MTGYLRHIGVVALAVTVAGTSLAQTPGPGQTAAGPRAAATDAGRPAVGAPRLQIEPADWDFGEVWFGEPVKRDDVTITNVGTGPLEITRGKSRCGWTGVSVDQKLLAPNESTILHVGYETTTGTEQVSQTVTLFTNDPTQPEVRFAIKGRCRPLCEMERDGRRVTTPTLSFGQLSRSEATTGGLRLRNRCERPVHLALPQTETRRYRVELREIEAGQEYELTATSVPPLPSGAVTELVKLTTDLDFLKELRVRVTGTVPATVRAVPASLTVSAASTARSTRDVRVVYPSDGPVSLLRVEADDPRVKWEIATPAAMAPGASAFHLLRVTLPPAAEFPAKGFKLTITTDSAEPECQQIEVPIRRSGQPAAATPAAQAAAPRGGGTSGPPAVATAGAEPEDEGADDEADSADAGQP